MPDLAAWLASARAKVEAALSTEGLVEQLIADEKLKDFAVAALPSLLDVAAAAEALAAEMRGRDIPPSLGSCERLDAALARLAKETP